MTLLNSLARRVVPMALALAYGVAVTTTVTALTQVKTSVPDVVPGASPVTVERITIHGKALEGNLEGDALNRPVIVFLPPSLSTGKDTIEIAADQPRRIHPADPCEVEALGAHTADPACEAETRSHARIPDMPTLADSPTQRPRALS
jgi:hypothetical protein